MEKQYVKGFIPDRNMVAKVAGVESPTDLDGYKFIGAVHRNTVLSRATIHVLKIRGDYEALKKMELQPIDDTITAAQPHVLVGPDVWELWG